MSDDCCAPAAAPDPRHRRALWAVLAINVLGFAVETGFGLAARSTALQADALDFLGDAANYAISLFAFGLALRWRAAAALLKGIVMGAFGLWVIGAAFWTLVNGVVPEAPVMGGVGIFALSLNVAGFLLLREFRHGDSNMRSVWICTRNDVLGNLAVLLAAAGVFGAGAGWPDAIVAAIMASLALAGSFQVIRLARAEVVQG
jgi:Co/Zn/Cd efflux system component